MENYIIANKTDVGMARQVNEDSMITFDSPNGRVVAVCDGMGGQAAGDVASQLACDIIRDILENNTFTTPEEAITKAMMAANQVILRRAAQNPEYQDMGSTCVMLIIKDGLVHYGWVGDSRIYYICNHTIRQLSKDQSIVQQLVDAGQITAAEAENHPQKNEITNALGVQGMTPPVLGQLPIKPEQGSVFLLCSDGLSGMVDNAHIERTVSQVDLSLQDKADQLVAMANANGGLDNITVQLVQFSDAVKPLIKKSNKGIKGMIYSVLGVLVVAAVCAVLYFFVLNKGKKEEKATPVKNETIDTRVNKVEIKKEPTETQKTEKQEPKKQVNKVEKKEPNKNNKNKKTKNTIFNKTNPDPNSNTGSSAIEDILTEKE